MKNSRSLLLSRPGVILGLAAGFVHTAGTAILFAVSTRDIASASIRTLNTQETLLEINRLLAALVDAETGQRGYILTGADTYLDPYTRAIGSIDGQIDSLRARFSGSPPQLAALDEIRRLISEKTSEMSRTIDLRRDHSVAPALHIMDSGEGLRTMNTIRDSVHELEKHELAELALHSASVSRRAAFFQSVSLIMLVSACTVGGLGAWLLLRRVNELETMITVCAWTRRVKFNGAWVSFEEYLHSRFNLQFTHGISEEASRKLKMEAIELVESNSRKKPAQPPVKPA